MNFLIVAPRYRPQPGEFYDFPLGLAYISAVLKQLGYPVHILNLNHHGQASDELLEKVIGEHDIDVLNYMDWIIELGPEGGPKGGELIASGPPEAIASNTLSKTGPFLAK